jgi:hypothetical protein
MKMTQKQETPKSDMDHYEKTLVLFLRITAIVLLIAVISAIMPFSWMIVIHRQLGMGELPKGPIMGYLTRSLSILYAMHGALVFFVSLDVRRYSPVVKCLAVLSIVLGAGLLVLDFVVGMSLFWIICEGPFLIVFYSFLFWLASKVQNRSPDGNVV